VEVLADPVAAVRADHAVAVTARVGLDRHRRHSLVD
jgi:hypothetical protein